jgi:hypothetical protein
MDVTDALPVPRPLFAMLALLGLEGVKKTLLMN